MAQLTDEFEPLPDEVAVMVVGSHPDDESIFFGGVLPYYARIRDVPTVLITMNAGGGNNDPLRDNELRAAARQYGLRYEPIMAGFDNCCFNHNRNLTTPGDDSLRRWSDDNTVQGGLDNASNYLATQIRQLKPAVVVGHELQGEYGHGNHQASARATAEAFDRAADPSVVLLDENNDPLPAWQADKLYLHLSPTNPLFHTGWSTPEPALNNMTAIEIANLGLAEHVSQIGNPQRFFVETYNDPGPQVSESTRNDFDPIFSSWAQYYGEGWGLHDRAPGFPLDSTSSGVIGTAHYGDFLENVDLSRFEPIVLGAFDLDDGAELEDYLVLNSNMFTERADLTPAQSLTFGDMNGDLRIDQNDFSLFKELFQTQNLATASQLALGQAPEPSGFALIMSIGGAWRGLRDQRQKSRFPLLGDQ